jgi:heat shock protein HslJ
MRGTETMVKTLRLAVRAAATVLLSGAVAAGCGAPAGKAAAPAAARQTAAAANNPLSGTAWRLIEIQSMDDAVGTARVDDPSRYTMHLNADGSVALRLNCNSATGNWTAEAGADRSSGKFEFGPLAATMALCPPPSVDEQLTKQAPYFRSYLLKDGRLYLSLMADGGIFAWEPLEAGK